MSLLSSRHGGQDLNTAAAGAVSEAQRALGDQIVAGSSPAWLRVSSLATDAWIAGDSGNVAGVKAIGGIANAGSGPGADQPAQRRPSASEKVSESKSAAHLDNAKKLSIISEDMLISALITFNQTLKARPDLKRQLEGYQADLISTSDDRMVAYLKQRIASVTDAISAAGALLADSPKAIEDGLASLQQTRNVTGTVYTRAEDGTFAFGPFSIGTTLPDGSNAVTWSHDGSGVAVRNIYTDAGIETRDVNLS
ncbi:hypothetical protein [Xanthobacter sediminis]